MRRLPGTPGTPRENSANQRRFLRVTWRASWHITADRNLAQHVASSRLGKTAGGTKRRDRRGRGDDVQENVLVVAQRTHALASVATRKDVSCQKKCPQCVRRLRILRVLSALRKSREICMVFKTRKMRFLCALRIDRAILTVRDMKSAWKAAA